MTVTLPDRARHRSRPAPPAPQRARMPWLLRGPADKPRWVRPALLGLLAGTALLYLWDLSASGDANTFYAAAVQAGTRSWKAWFFGSLDSANFITVDKPPASLWVMGLSARLFGFSSWSMLVPQALEGVAAVGLLYATVRRWSGAAAGLLAGAALAVTPAAALMFRYNHPDVLLTLLLVAGAYCLTRAVETASTRWLLLASTAVGFAFLTKMLQAFLVLPAFAAAYAVAAPTSLRRRVSQLVAAGTALVVSAGWWIAAAQLWPAGSRPYIGGSADNTVLDLVLGYNGVGRLLGGTGNPGGAGAGGSAGSSFGGATGLTRLFGTEMGNQVSWLLPAALVALAAGLWLTRRAPRTDRTRAALLLWGGWLLVTGLVLSYMRGIVHPYYTVALAPAITALVAVGGRELWRHRRSTGGRVGLAAMMAAAGGWSVVLLSRNPSWHPELRYAVLAATLAVSVALVVPAVRLRRTALVLATSGVVAGLLGSTSYAAATAGIPHSGTIPSAGPVSAATGGSGGPGGGGGRVAAAANGLAPTGSFSSPRNSPSKPGGFAPEAAPPTGAGAAAGGGTVTPSTGGPSGTPGGGLVGTGSQLTTLLKGTTSTWAAATVGATSAAQLELASGKAVMAIGGWNGSDPAPTLGQFEQYVKDGKVRYLVAGGQGGGAGGQGASTSTSGQGGGAGGQGASTSSQIITWVQAHFTATTVGGTTVYDLSSAKS